MAGLITPTKGDVSFQNLLLRGVAPGVAMVFQNFALFPWLTVRGNVLLPVGTLAEAEQQARLEKVLNTVGLGAYEYAYPRELSGGMKAAGRHRPFADRRTGGPCHGRTLQRVGRPHRRDASAVKSADCWPIRTIPGTMVFVTHNITEAVFLATRIVVNGRSARPGGRGRAQSPPYPAIRKRRNSSRSSNDCTAS